VKSVNHYIIEHKKRKTLYFCTKVYIYFLFRNISNHIYIKKIKTFSEAKETKRNIIVTSITV